MKEYNALLPLAEGFEEIECVTIVDVLRRAGINVDVAGLKSLDVKGSHGITLRADMLLDDVDRDKYNLIVMPGGMPGSVNLRDDERVLELVRYIYSRGGYACAICAAPVVLYKACLLDGKKFTIHPSTRDMVDNKAVELDVVVDGRIITGWSPGAAMKFALKIVEVLLGNEEVDKLLSAMLYEGYK
ncbi:MAG: DJ-1/PfpI family protein [Candidatus Marinimicrobia bacterium]|nr:DJ-1/PfpI family protein [Candidatus Neomarinimicrobiota bacterium]